MRRITTAVYLAATAALLAACDTGAVATESSDSVATSTRATQSTPDSGAEPVSCAETREWATNDTQADPTSTDALYGVRAGQHECYDRMVLDINGPAEVGYLVGYVPAVAADGSGEPVPVDGTALQVIVRAPAQGFDAGGHQPGRKLGDIGDYLYTTSQLEGWASLRAVRFAGSFEGQSTIAVGVREELPFRVFTQLDKSNQIRRLVIDIAHDQ
jgi:hypothetical protein